MASPQIVSAFRFAGPRRVALLGALSAALALTLLPTGSAQADTATTVDAAAAQAQVQALADKAEIVVEKYDASQDALAAAQLQLSADRAAIDAAQTTVDSTQGLVDAIARDSYESGALGGAASVMLSQDPQAALRGAAYLEQLAENRDRDLAQATSARNALVQAQASAGQELASVQALQVSLQAEQKTINVLIGKQQAALTASQAQAAAQTAATAQVSRSDSRAALPKAAVAVAAKGAAPRAAAPKAAVPQVAAPKAAAPAVAVPAVASSKAAAVLRYAYAQLGKPYRYGAAGARTFDCSGLTMRAWAAAGVAISHNAAAQYYATKHVARSALQPGDLVYFGRPIHHVGIYIGGGRFIEAPYTGADVRISNLSARHDYAGASRP